MQHVCTQAQAAGNTSHSDSTAHTCCDNTPSDPYQLYMKSRAEKKGMGVIGQREEASYPYANMQIRTLLRSLHVIEVGCLSAASMETSSASQNVTNGRNSVKSAVELHGKRAYVWRAERRMSVCVCVCEGARGCGVLPERDVTFNVSWEN